MRNVDLKDRFETLCADIVALRRNEAFLTHLFEANMADWRTARLLCKGLPELEAEIMEIEGLAEDQVRVMWLPRSWEDDENRCLIVFYLDRLISGFFAVYNRTRLSR